MTVDTVYADVSEFQPAVDDHYPYKFIAFRSNDGTYRDHHFAQNIAWAKAACDSGRLAGFIVYFVFETNWLDAVSTLEQMVGKPHPNMAVMIDVENWSGKIKGNHSVQINAARERLIGWLGGNRRRVIGYANAGDFDALWPNRGDCNVVLANYSANPVFPRKIAHQFSDRFVVPPFGACDVNSADGMSPAEFAAVLGLPVRHPSPKPRPETPAVIPKPAPDPLEEVMAIYGSKAAFETAMKELIREVLHTTSVLGALDYDGKGHHLEEYLKGIPGYQTYTARHAAPTGQAG